MANTIGFEELKSIHRQVRDGFSGDLDLRIHRALSWLNRAEQCDDDDGAFVFLWIALNAAYSNDAVSGLSDSVSAGQSGESGFQDFFQRLLELDSGKRISGLLWDDFSGPIRKLLNNEFVYQRFWDFQNQVEGVDEWRISFGRAKNGAQAALANQKTPEVLQTVLERLYTLRTQLIEGGATWNSQVNRTQVRDGTLILKSLVPAVISIMMENADAHWTAASYPVNR